MLSTNTFFLFHTSEQGIINLATANNNINVKTRIKSV